jgi:hypothetical protein
VGAEVHYPLSHLGEINQTYPEPRAAQHLGNGQLAQRREGLGNRHAQCSLPPAVHKAALTAGRQHTLESAARAAFDALSTATR